MRSILFISDDWDSLTGNVAKLGLGVFSVFFDLIFVVQHYFIYRYSFSRSTYLRNVFRSSFLA